MTLRRQIAAGFAVLLVPLAIVAILALTTIARLGGAVDAVLLDNERSLAAAAEMDGALERLDSAALLTLLGRGDQAAEVARPARQRFRDALAVAAGNLTIDGERETVRQIEAAFQQAAAASDGMAGLGTDEARAVYARQFTPAFERTQAGLADLRAANRAAAQAAGARAGDASETALWGVGLGALLALALGVWAAARLSRQIADQA